MGSEGFSAAGDAGAAGRGQDIAGRAGLLFGMGRGSMMFEDAGRLTRD